MADDEQDEGFNMVDVASGNLSAVGYNKGTSKMRVEFLKSGALYEYSGVPEGVYNAVVNGASVGEMFDALIKKGGFAYQRIS